MFFPSNNELIVNFGNFKAGNNWIVVNDGVMGGESNSKATILENSLLFGGNISLENNGGFASIRSELTNVDLSNTESVTIKYRSEGKNIGLRLLKEERFYFPYLKTNLQPTNWEWATEVIQMNQFLEYRLGKETNKKLTGKDFRDIIRIGLIATDKTEGQFKIEIDYIKFN